MTVQLLDLYKTNVFDLKTESKSKLYMMISIDKNNLVPLKILFVKKQEQNEAAF